MFNKKITISFFASIIGLVPILASPLVIKGEIKSEDSIFEIANSDRPKTEYGWNYLSVDSYERAQTHFENMTNWIKENSNKVDEDAVAQKELDNRNYLIGTDDFQKYTAYQLKRILANIFLFEINRDKYPLPGKGDQKNFVEMIFTNQTPAGEDSDFVFEDATNRDSVNLGGANLDFDMRILATDSYYYFNKYVPNFLSERSALTALNVLNDENIYADFDSEKSNGEKSDSFLEMISFKKKLINYTLNSDLKRFISYEGDNPKTISSNFFFISYVLNKLKYDEMLFKYINYFEKVENNIDANIKSKINDLNIELNSDNVFLQNLTQNLFNGVIEIGNLKYEISNFNILDFNSELNFANSEPIKELEEGGIIDDRN